MKILVKVRPSAKKELVEQVKQEGFSFSGPRKEGLDFYRIWVKEPAVDGKANEAVIRALSKHLKVPPSMIKIKSGQQSHQKIIEVL